MSVVDLEPSNLTPRCADPIGQSYRGSAAPPGLPLQLPDQGGRNSVAEPGTVRNVTATRPVASSPGVSARMARVLRRDTKPEIALRREVHARGLRYRVDRSPIPALRGRADLVFQGAQVAVYVDGCFWHACPEHGTLPKSNREWWRHKLESNTARDVHTDELLRAAGWEVIRVWEHDDVLVTAALIESAVRRRSGGRSARGMSRERQP